MRSILIVEDDLILGESLTELLNEEGFEITWVKDGNEAIDTTYNKHFDIFLFDVDIPFVDGFELLKSLRESGDQTPCIFLTAKVDTISPINGFDVGADDYIKKPFDIDELLIRINKQIKNSFKTYDKIINYKDISYNIVNDEITKADKKIILSPTELKLFTLFMKNQQKLLTKEDILYYIHNKEEGSEAALRVQVSKLKKLGLNITNQRGIGYKLE
jgi:DNA-binding response OmpR family regulator